MNASAIVLPSFLDDANGAADEKASHGGGDQIANHLRRVLFSFVVGGIGTLHLFVLRDHQFVKRPEDLRFLGTVGCAETEVMV